MVATGSSNPQPTSSSNDSPEQLAHWVHYCLLTGLVVSTLLLGIGLLRVLASGKSAPNAPPLPLLQVFSRAFEGDGVNQLELGLVILMLTPVARVGVLAIGWWKSGERKFALVALVVLVLLGCSLALGVG